MAMSETGDPTAWSTTANEAHAPRENGQQPILKTLSPGTYVDGRYEIISVIGQGGCGCVYKVHQLLMNKTLALKTLNPSTSRITIMRLQKEAQAMSLLEHPNIAHAFDFGMLGQDQPFFVMEFVNGPTLAQHLKQVGTMSVEATVELFTPICQALSYAHEKGVIHRDIKPSNIILAKDTDQSNKLVPKLVDFGIAKIQYGDQGSATLTKTGEIFGTPLFMSPEQCQGAKVDHRSDIYSLGCVMFQALTGSPPFSGDNPMKTMMMHSSADIPSLKEMSPGVEFPAAIEQIISKMLVKEPSVRYQNFEQVLKDLQAVREGQHEVTPVASQRGSKKSARATLAALALLVVAAGIGVGYHNHSLQSEKESTKPVKLDRSIIADSNPFKATEKAMVIEGRSYFSQRKGDYIQFKFPPKQRIGKLHYWTSDTEKKEVMAERSVTVPRDAKLTLFAYEPLLTQPMLWSKFRQTDLYGVRMDFLDAMSSEKWDDAIDDALTDLSSTGPKRKAIDIMKYAEEKIDPNSLQDANLKAQNLNAVMTFDNLHLLGLLFADFNDRTWLHMGTLQSLRWVWLDGCKLNGKKPRGEDLVKLSNLNNLRVFSVDKLDSPGAVLSKLIHSKELKRLSLGVVPITKQDLSLIAKIPRLDTLRLRELTLSDDALLSQLAAAPHLERLALDRVKMKDCAMLSGLVKLKHLKELVVDYPEESKEFQNINVVEGCQVHFEERAHTNWFNWMEENPDVTGLW